MVFLSETAAEHSQRQPRKPFWERVAAPATILGLFVAAGGLLFAGKQLEVANQQSKQNADATELQAFGNFNHELNDPAQLKRFDVAANHLISVALHPQRHSQIPFGDVWAIITVAGQYDHLAKLFLADRAALPHAKQLFAERMACVLLDFEAISTRTVNLHLFQVNSLTTFTRATRCPGQLTINGITIGFP
jgi:hypothetical protein